MKTCFHITTTTALFTVTMLLTGCVARTTVKNESRQNIHFASAQAAEVFYAEYLKTYYPSDRTNSACFYIPWPWPYSHHHVTTDNVYFNRAVRSADENQDGTISENEASAYAAPEKVSVIINGKHIEFAPEVRTKLVEKAVELLSSCIHKDLKPGQNLKDATKESHLSIKFSSPRTVEVPAEEITVQVQKMVITLPLNSGGIWVRSDKGVIYFAKFKHTIVQELEKLLKESKHGNDA